MKSSKQKALWKLLDEQLVLIKREPPIPTDYVSLAYYVAYLELRQEHEFLSELLEHPKTFIDHFKKRCLWRMENSDRALCFTQCPESVVNQLYVNIILLLFSPKSISELLKIIAPEIKSQVFIELQESFENNVTKQQLKSPTFTIQFTKNLNDLNTPVSLQSLQHFVFSRTSLFDVRVLCRFPLKQHVRLHQVLSEKDPLLAQRVYSYNDAFQELSSDLMTYSNQAVKPRAVLEDLVIAFKYGGSSYSNSEYANRHAENARKRFYNYYNALPKLIKGSLRKLRCNRRSLGEIIDQEIEKGTCVETAGLHIKQILEANPHGMLDSPTSLTANELSTLERKYKFKPDEVGLDSQKSFIMHQELPSNLAQKAVKNIPIGNEDDLIFVFITFPVSCYPLFLDKMAYDDLRLSFISKILQKKILNTEQRQAIAQALKPLLEFNYSDWRLLYWIIGTEDSIFIDAAFRYIPSERLYQIGHLATEVVFKVTISFLPARLYPYYWPGFTDASSQLIIKLIREVLRLKVLNDENKTLFAKIILPILLKKMEWNNLMYWVEIFNTDDSILINEALAISLPPEPRRLTKLCNIPLTRLFSYFTQEMHKNFWSTPTSKREAEQNLNTLTSLIDAKILTSATLQFIAKIITPLMRTYGQEYYLDKVLDIGEPILMYEAYAAIAKPKLLSCISKIYENEPRAKHIARLKPLSQWMPLIRPADRTTVIQLVTSNFKPLIYQTVRCSFKEILTRYPRNRRLDLIKNSGITKWEVDLELCALVPEYHRLAFLKWAKNYMKKLEWRFLFNADAVQIVKLKGSFVPDLLKLLIIVEDNKGYAACNLVRVVENAQSFDEIKFRILKDMDYLSGHLLPLFPLNKRKECLNYEWYKHSIQSYLEDEIDHLPKASGLRKKLKEIEFEIKNNEHTLDELHTVVIQIKDIVKIHQDRGWIGFFKCNCMRETAQYNKLLCLFEPFGLESDQGLKNNKR